MALINQLLTGEGTGGHHPAIPSAPSPAAPYLCAGRGRCGPPPERGDAHGAQWRKCQMAWFKGEFTGKLVFFRFLLDESEGVHDVSYVFMDPILWQNSWD